MERHRPGTRRKRQRKPADVYARELLKRYGNHAGQLASNRYDAAKTEATAAYYEDVMTEIQRAWREDSLKAATSPETPPRQHATKKTPAQLDREIAEALSGSSGSTVAEKASTDPAAWPQIFDTLKPGQIVYIAMTAVMGGGRASSGDYFPHKVGRRSKSKSPRWWSEAISLEPADGSKIPSFAKYKLWKRKSGDISMSHGDMAVMLKGIYAP